MAIAVSVAGATLPPPRAEMFRRAARAAFSAEMASIRIHQIETPSWESLPEITRDARVAGARAMYAVFAAYGGATTHRIAETD